MEVKVEEIGTLTRKITVTIPSETVQPMLNKSYDKLKKDVKMKGFRRGKVPRSYIVKSYKSQVEQETGQTLIQENYFTAVENKEIEPIVHPEIKDLHYNEDGSFTFVAEVDIRPTFELGTYKGLELIKEPILVTDEEIALELERLQKEKAPLQTVENRAVQEGDSVTLDFQGYHNGTEMPQVKNNNYTVVIGSGMMDAGFEAKIVGMQVGEEARHEIDFPADHPNPLLKDKKIEFQVKIQQIQEKILPDLDDSFAALINPEFKHLDDLKADIKKTIETSREETAEARLTDKMMEQLLEKHTFEVPKRLVAFEIEQMIKQTEQQLSAQQMSLEAAGLKKETLAQQNEPIAEQRVRGDFILKKIAEVEDIKVEDEDMDRGFKRIGDMYNMPVARVKEFFKSREDLLPFMNELLNEKVLNWLREQAVFVEAPKTAEKEEEKDLAADTTE
ncbi:MAG: trigger factor [Deltaproteobacteria bacterium]|nr:MAG: trigger factor [Deltaproteobacteria bacterium]PIE73355.1 MAG: trigger factor [Deltaproteobacteria bacterium]